jgi:hypothetical protein
MNFRDAFDSARLSQASLAWLYAHKASAKAELAAARKIKSRIKR